MPRTRLLLILAALMLPAAGRCADRDQANFVGVETVRQPAPSPDAKSQDPRARESEAEVDEALASSRTCRAKDGPKTLSCDVGGHFTLNTGCGCRDQTSGKIYYGTVYP